MKKAVIVVLAVTLVIVGLGVGVRMLDINGGLMSGQRGIRAANLQFERLEFAVAYRGLTPKKGDLKYNAYWGFGSGNEEDSSFVKAAMLDSGSNMVVYNPNFKGAEYAVLKHEGTKVETLYFDLNADGALSDDEKHGPRPNWVWT